jgi:hypothetical protein
MQIIPYFLLTLRVKLPIGYHNKQGITDMSLETLLVSVGILGALQGAYLVLKNMEARTVTGPAMWASTQGSYHENLEARAESRMKKDFEIARAKAIMAMAGEFAAKA